MQKDELTLIATTAVKRIRDRIRKGNIVPKTIKKSSKKTLVESGKLLRSIKYRIDGDKIIISAGGAGIPYAKIHHYGGRIFPKKAKYLAIPLTRAARNKSPREFEDTFIQKGIIFRNVKKGKIEAIYKLKKFVDIPARPYMFLEQKDKDFIKQRLVNYVEAQFEKKQ